MKVLFVSAYSTLTSGPDEIYDLVITRLDNHFSYPSSDISRKLAIDSRNWVTQT